MTSEFVPRIEAGKCINCGLCVRHCPRQVLAAVKGEVVVVNPTACTYSGICEEVCPTGAISLIYEIVFAPTPDFNGAGSVEEDDY
jgi:formate hydrogenlyase subunit 6/NADH:ubiquinone oxidoreductase subunit I